MVVRAGKVLQPTFTYYLEDSYLEAIYFSSNLW